MKTITSVEEFVERVRTAAAAWPVEQPRWFRGEPNVDTRLLPSLYRMPNGAELENRLLQTFRSRAAAFSTDPLPDRKHTDKWLFLAQHVGIPTRLLDWSEGALIGLYFALKSERPIVWMLNPLYLNHFATASRGERNELREFPLPWFNPVQRGRNMANENMRGAWERDAVGIEVPMAIHPTYVHHRLRAQHSCFTVHGKRKASLDLMVSGDMLKRFEVDPESRPSIQRDLATLGVTESVAYPDLDGLARDLVDRFCRAPVINGDSRPVRLWKRNISGKVPRTASSGQKRVTAHKAGRVPRRIPGRRRTQGG